MPHWEQKHLPWSTFLSLSLTRQISFLLVLAPLKLVLQNLHCLLKPKFLKFHFLWGQSIWGMPVLRSTALKSWNKRRYLSSAPPQYQALVSSSQASTHADKSMSCFTEPGVSTRVNAGSKAFYMWHYKAQEDLPHTTEMKLDQRRLMQHCRTADKGVADNTHWPFSR